MQLYSALCRPAGQLTHEVPKSSLTAPEVILLRSIHGDDGVVHLEPTKVEGSFDVNAERARLKSVYGEKAFSKVFGSTFGSTMPTEVPKDWLNGSTPAPEEDSPSAPATH